MEGENRERAVLRQVSYRKLARVMIGENISMNVKSGLRNSILLPTLTHWNREFDIEQGTAVKSACYGN